LDFEADILDFLNFNGHFFEILTPGEFSADTHASGEGKAVLLYMLKH
jgi:hypothetical protein